MSWRNGFQIVTLLSLMILAACGGGPAEEQKTETKVSPEVYEPAGVESTPEQIGEEVAKLYGQAMQDVVALLADKPAVDEVIPKLEDLKESYVQKLVELGRKREALSEADRATVDYKIRGGLGSIPRELYRSYLDAHKHYMGTDAANIIAAFNIITQYANFDLLRQQSPAEAERLGL
jgi:hypothetical protein